MANLEVAPWVGELLNDRTSHTIYTHAGIGSGKTFAHVLKHSNWFLENQDCPLSWWLEPTHTLVEQGAIPEWKKYFDLRNWKEGREYRLLNSKPIKIYLYSGLNTHEIAFLSADRPEHLVAANIGALSVDEAGSTKAAAVEYAVGRVRDKRANYSQVWMFGAPQGMNHFADKANFQGHKESLIEGIKFLERSFEISTYENENNLAPGYIARQLQMFGHNPNKVLSWIYGKFTSFFEGRAHPDYDSAKDRHELEADPGTVLYLAWDFNVQPLAWVAGQRRYCIDPLYLTDGHRYITVGESSGSSNTIMDGCAEFIRQFDPKVFETTPIRITGDANGHSRSVRASGSCYDDAKRYLKEFYRDVKVIAPAVNPEVAVRVEATNKAFSYSLALVHKDHKNLDRSLLVTAWEAGTKNLKKPQGEDWTHWGEAFGYWISQMMENERLGSIILPTVMRA